MLSFLRGVAEFFGIMALAAAGSAALAGLVHLTHPLVGVLIIFIGIPSAIGWRVWWGIKNPLPPSNTDSW